MKLLLIGLGVATCPGCWDEIRYDPQNLSTTPPATPVEQSEPAVEEPVVAEPAAEQSASVVEASEQETSEATADDLFGESTEDPILPTSTVPLETVWQLGSKWSLAVCIFGRGYAGDKYVDVYGDASVAAGELSVELPSLPEDAATLSDRDKLNIAIDVLLKQDGPQLASSVGEKHSARHQALCELAVGTHVLLLNYLPSREEIEPSAATIRMLARKAELPSELWRPVVTAIEDRSAFSELKAAVLKLHKQTATYLKSAAAE